MKSYVQIWKSAQKTKRFSWIPASFIIGIVLLSQTSYGQSPGGISSGLKLWLKADAGIAVVDGTKISSWPDQSSSAYNLTQATAAIQPTYYKTTASNLVNFNPSVVFSVSTLTTMTNTSANLFGGGATGSSYHFIAVGRDNSVQNIASPNFGNNQLHSILGNGSTGDNPAMDFQKDAVSFNDWALKCNPGVKWSGGNATIYNGGGIGSSTEVLPAAYLNQLKNAQPQVIGIGYTLGAANNLFSWVDGFKQQTTLVESVSHITNTNYFSLGISGGTEYWTGPINEAIAYNRQLSDAEMQQVNTYLAIKYGVTLGQGNNSNTVPTYNVGLNAANYNYIASDATVIWNATSNAGNRYNIAGIGRDDSSALNQKQSESVNFGSQVILGLGTIATTNAGNTNTFTSNKSFSIWGDDNGTLPLTTSSPTFTYFGSSLNLRMNRTWAIQNTGVAQTIKISIPSSTFGTVAATNCEQLEFIHSPDNSFTSVDYSGILVLNGTNYECLYTFPTGTSYFSFGRIELASSGIVSLPLAATPIVFQGKCLENGWTYYYSVVDSSQKIFALNDNGNVLPNYSMLTGAVTWQNTPWTATNGVYTTNFMQRLLTVTDSSHGTYTVNGGVKLRLFADSTELKNTYPVGFTGNSSWFKHPADAVATVADLTYNSVNNATFLTPSAVGLEDNIHYVEFSNITGFSTFGFVASNYTIPLPVELVDFTVNTQNCVIQLLWQTAIEQGSSNYIIEKSQDGQHWQNIGIVAAAGTSVSLHSYSYLDNDPLPGKNFYRLDEVDENGNSSFSSVRLLNYVPCDGSTSESLQVYPNPTTGIIHIQISGTSIPRTIAIYDPSGKTVMVQNSFSFTQELDLGSLVPGLYVLQVGFSDGSVKQQKIIKI